MRRHHPHPGRKREQGVVITLVAVFMASVVLVMAALAIDLTTLYTARSEAQLAADGAALAGARVLANSGMTSSADLPSFPTGTAETLARTVATQVALSNQIGGKAISGTGTCGSTGVSICFNDTAVDFMSNPHVTAQVTRPDLPTFFLRFWSKQLAVAASATVEAYNPSGLSSRRDAFPPIAPVCVKPWLLPNIDPTGSGRPIFSSTRRGTIQNPALLGYGWPLVSNPGGAPQAGKYYAGAIDATGFPKPTTALPSCSSSLTTDYEIAVAGCVSQPIQCGAAPAANINIDSTPRDAETVLAAECLIHYTGLAGDTDTVNGQPAVPLPLPFEFVAGNQNPVVPVGTDVLVSDSVVTIPVYDSNGVAPPPTVDVIGFLQVFLNPQSAVLPNPATDAPPYQIPVTIINQIGCGTDSTGTPIYGNGPSAVPVRLITPP